MMSVGLQGLKGGRIRVEADVRVDKEQCVIIGLPDTSIKESKEPILSCLHHLDFDLSMKKITIHLSPANMRKSGTGFDGAMLLVAYQELTDQPLPLDDSICIITSLSLHEDLAKIMWLINRKYSDYYAKRYRHVGQIYQGRYYSKEADTPQAMLAVSRYIHRNPIETKTPMVKQLNMYPFSSFPYYCSSEIPDSYLDTEALPRYLPPPMEKTKEAYAAYCLMELEEIMEFGEIVNKLPRLSAGQ
ncbi:hypothetical protein NCCP2331_23720 [Sporosarcina sp. NCCP-2331]|nr:hypothetical protein NCCP2331_23720 [Sporosarcina sp. NCCP-2331]GLB56255.1 hypothetical protein NCCP2378_20420 [Sporosarcina sp. NCCP-2378]